MVNYYSGIFRDTVHGSGKRDQMIYCPNQDTLDSEKEHLML